MTEEIKPKGITCPEGIWSLEAMLRFSDKQKGEDGQSRIMADISHGFIQFLMATPKLEVFTISSYSGNKRLIDRDYLRSRRAISHFIQGRIPFDSYNAKKEDGEYIFVNRTQFENYLADKPLEGCIFLDQEQKAQNLYVPVLAS